MRGLTCIRVGALLARRAAGLSESERLEVESHRAECAHCQEEARALSGIRALVNTEPVLSSSSRELVLRRAFELADLAPAARPASRGSFGQRRGAVVSLVAAAAALLLFVGWTQRPRWLAGEAADHVAAGSVALAGREIAVNGEIPANAELHSATGARLAVGNAEVDLKPGSSVVWGAEQSNLVLRHGAVSVTVEHVPHQRFRVSTSTFVVEVVGTQFKVDAEGVQVTRGTVRVLSTDGQVLAVLPAGGAWAAKASPKQSEPVLPPPSTPSTSSTPLDGARDTATAPSKEVASSGSAAQWLSEARHALAVHRVSDAEHAVDAALRLHPSQYELAEARTLQAECAGAAGDAERAVRLYLGVAKQFGGPAAENALFSAARLRARQGASAQARALFEDYVRRYPAGRFRQEAERHLLTPRASGASE